MIISTGGTYLVEHYPLFDRFQQLDAAARTGKPLVLFTQSLGPFQKASSKRWLKRLEPGIDLVLLRDERSYRHLRDVDFPAEKLVVTGDAAFALANMETLQRARSRTIPPNPKVAVSVRGWKHFREGSTGEKSKQYRLAIAAAVTQLVKSRNAQVTFLSTCQGIPEYWTDDSKEAFEILALLDPEIRQRVQVDASFIRAERMIGELAGFDLVIATRMHMAILALCAGTPVFPIAYEFKTEELFRSLGLGDRVVDIERASADSLPSQILAFLVDLPLLRDGVLDGVIKHHQSAMSASQLLFGLDRLPEDAESSQPDASSVDPDLL
jgi:colanic acid/amylovoran biosynthesis protein